MMHLLSTLLLLPLSVAAYATNPTEPIVDTVTIYHRFLPIDRREPLPPYEPRLSVHLTQPTHHPSSASDLHSGQASPSSSFFLPTVQGENIQSKENPLRPVNLQTDAWYEVALGLPSGEFSSTTMKADVLTLQLAPEAGSTPFHLAYSIRNIPRDGSCPGTSSSATHATEGFETSIFLKTPTVQTAPLLATPPPWDAETGRPAVAPVEKSFLAKYWVYMAIPIVLLIMMPETEAEAAAGAAK